MNNKITAKDLENMRPDNLRDNFYYLCQENSPREIEQCFKNKNINNQLTGYMISYGLMGAARSDKIENATAILYCVTKYTNINTGSISYNAAINLALKKNHLDFAHELIIATNYLQNEVKCLINRKIDVATNNNKNAYIAVMIDQSGSMNQSSIVNDKYNKFNVSSFDMFNKDSDKLEFLLSHKISLNHIKNIVQKACENENMIPLISIVKSQYLEILVQDKEFKIFMKDNDYKNTKNELQHLIDNALLEKKLTLKLPEKNTKIIINKI